MTIAATATPADVSASAVMCSQAPRTLRSCEWSSSTRAATRFNTVAAAAIAMTGPAWIACGCTSRPDRLERDEHGDDEQGRRVRLRGEDRAAVIAETAAVVARPLDEVHGEQREVERGDVGEVVAGVGERVRSSA